MTLAVKGIALARLEGIFAAEYRARRADSLGKRAKSVSRRYTVLSGQSATMARLALNLTK